MFHYSKITRASKTNLNPTKSNDSNKNKDKMTLTANEYDNMCSRQLNCTYDGDPLGLSPFIDSIGLLQLMDAQKEHEEILRGVVRSKLKGTARDYVPANATIDEIKHKLKNNIKVTESKIISGRLMALKADKMNFADYANKAEALAEQLKRALICEEILNEKANQMTIEQTALQTLNLPKQNRYWMPQNSKMQKMS